MNPAEGALPPVQEAGGAAGGEGGGVLMLEDEPLDLQDVVEDGNPPPPPPRPPSRPQSTEPGMNRHLDKKEQRLDRWMVRTHRALRDGLKAQEVNRKSLERELNRNNQYNWYDTMQAIEQCMEFISIDMDTSQDSMNEAIDKFNNEAEENKLDESRHLFYDDMSETFTAMKQEYRQCLVAVKVTKSIAKNYNQNGGDPESNHRGVGSAGSLAGSAGGMGRTGETPGPLVERARRPREWRGTATLSPRGSPTTSRPWNSGGGETCVKDIWALGPRPSSLTGRDTRSSVSYSTVRHSSVASEGCQLQTRSRKI
jgi:hypothetical protein